MSSSAFTPSTTTVTNEVPVNVPVVTDWVAYTPTLTNFGAKVTTRNEAFWRRIGSDIEIKFAYTGNDTAAGVGSNVLLMSLPAGLTFDNSKSPTPGSYTDDDYFGTYREYSIVTSSIYSSVQQIFPHSSTQFRFIKQGTQNSLTTSDLNVTRTVYLTGEIRAPIAEWAGSGTTTLATRAVEEYASNSGLEGTTIGSTYLNSTYFEYGPNGSLMPNITTTDTTGGSTSYGFKFKTPILPTDAIILEYKDATTWRQVGQGPLGTLFSVRQLTTRYGAVVNITNADAGEGIVEFGRGGTNPTTGAYGAVGNNWSGFYSSGYRWRIRKVSGGAQVGYPVSARNIVGDTSGSVVPTGMLGEQVLFTTRSVSAVTPNWVANTSPLITLTPGTWILFPQITGIAAAGLTSVLAFLSTDSNSNSTGNLSLENGAFVLAANATINQSDIPMAMIYLNVTQNTPIYAKARTSGANTTITLKGRAIRIA